MQQFATDKMVGDALTKGLHLRSTSRNSRNEFQRMFSLCVVHYYDGIQVSLEIDSEPHNTAQICDMC